MRIIDYLVHTWEDVLFGLHHNGKRTVFNVLLWLTFIVLGVVVASNSVGSWWHANRYSFCKTIIYGGFAKVPLILWQDFLLVLLLVFFVAVEWKWCVYLLECIVCFYFGAHCVVCICDFTLLGVLYLIMYFVVTLLASLLLCCIAKENQWYFCKKLIVQCKPVFITALALFFVQFVGVFLFLGAITALI